MSDDSAPFADALARAVDDAITDVHFDARDDPDARALADIYFAGVSAGFAAGYRDPCPDCDDCADDDPAADTAY